MRCLIHLTSRVIRHLIFMTYVLRSRNLRRVYSRRRSSGSRRRRAWHRSVRMRRLRRRSVRGPRRHRPHPHRSTSDGLLYHPRRHHLRRHLSHRRLILLLRQRHVRIRPLSRSRRRRPRRAARRRSRRSRRHRRRHHRAGMSHTLPVSRHPRSVSRNHPPRPSSTLARIVIAVANLNSNQIKSPPPISIASRRVSRPPIVSRRLRSTLA
jgi:hypothetical protein